MISMSSVRPTTSDIRTWVRPHGHGVGSSDARSPVRYRITGSASLVRVVKVSSPTSPGGTGSPVWIERFREEVVLEDVRSVLRFDALVADPRPDHLAQP